MNKINWSTIVALTLVVLVIFMTWGAFGGWSGMMGPGWGMFFLTLCFAAFLAALAIWVVGNLKKK